VGGVPVCLNGHVEEEAACNGFRKSPPAATMVRQLSTVLDAFLYFTGMKQKHIQHYCGMKSKKLTVLLSS